MHRANVVKHVLVVCYDSYDYDEKVKSKQHLQNSVNRVITSNPEERKISCEEEKKISLNESLVL